VIKRGWGERHPLCANDKHWFRLLFHGILEQPLPVPEGLVLVYAPRNERELQVLDIILKAAIWYGTKGELCPDISGAEYLSTGGRPDNQEENDRICQRCMCPQNRTTQQTPSGTSTPEETQVDVSGDPQTKTSPDAHGTLASSSLRVWGTPDYATTWHVDQDVAACPLPPFQSPNRSESLWLRDVPSEQTEPTAVGDDANPASVDMGQGQGGSRFSPGPDFDRSRGGPSSSPHSGIGSFEWGQAIDSSDTVWASGGLHSEDAEQVDTDAVGHHSLQNREWEEERDQEDREPGSDFTEDDFF
jgi:hypothetical protein